ncbi:hypothetical protein [Enterobacter asburiae]|uniref:hypothetical protein n=1 Tax=Enterobacter asburiae TaxID=61645 RepID=UPI00264880D4|nr:hypothetical protein [Enterobacter asburiae]
MSNVECPPEFRAATSIGFTFFRPTLSCWFAAASSPGRNTLHFVPVAITGIRIKRRISVMDSGIIAGKTRAEFTYITLY